MHLKYPGVDTLRNGYKGVVLEGYNRFIESCKRPFATLVEYIFQCCLSYNKIFSVLAILDFILGKLMLCSKSDEIQRPIGPVEKG